MNIGYRFDKYKLECNVCGVLPEKYEHRTEAVEAKHSHQREHDNHGVKSELEVFRTPETRQESR